MFSHTPRALRPMRDRRLQRFLRTLLLAALAGATAYMLVAALLRTAVFDGTMP